MQWCIQTAILHLVLILKTCKKANVMAKSKLQKDIAAEYLPRLSLVIDVLEFITKVIMNLCHAIFS